MTRRMMLYLVLAAFATLLALYDFRSRRVPNWATLAVLIAGVIAYWPGTTEIWVTTAVVVTM